ncbi:hypothetical protein [Methylotuvimicrobium sp. KM1]|uniref:hypothetical protein n=1 Tax=Methylotuvimicrobium sp. KM1 TaxID=3377707 RepID=UPI00384DEF68
MWEPRLRRDFQRYSAQTPKNPHNAMTSRQPISTFFVVGKFVLVNNDWDLGEKRKNKNPLAKYTFRTSNFGSAGGGLGVLGKGFASMEQA